jgi:5-methylcytosine-specific restriction protein A
VAIDSVLSPGAVLNQKQLMATFRSSGQGGMQRSLRTNSLVLISDHVKSIYGDRWIGDVLHYTGTGRLGDQIISGTQNKTLAESGRNGVDLYLFEVFKSGEYRFQGNVELAGEPYQEPQPDEQKHERLVWVFPLRIKSGSPVPIAQNDFSVAVATREKRARKLSDEEIKKRAASAPKQSGRRQVVGDRYERNPYVAEHAKRRANGICELCKTPAPFADAKGEAYLETHHVDWLARGGDDSIQNTVALCPNCHRKMHVVDLAIDKALLKQLLRKS